MHALNNLVQAKLLYYENPASFIYRDLKKLIRTYCITTETDKFDYDSVDLEIIQRLASPLNDQEKLAIFSYARRELLKIHQIKSAEQLERITRNIEYKTLWKSHSLFSIIRALLLYPTISVWHLFFTLFLVLMGCFLVLMPSSQQSFETFAFNKVEFTSNFYLNHLLNVFVFLFKLNPKVSITPLTVTGVFISVILKSFFILFIVNYLIKYLTKYLRIEV